MCFNVTLILYAKRAVGHLISFWEIFKADFRHLCDNSQCLRVFLGGEKNRICERSERKGAQKCSSLPMHSECSSLLLCDDGHFTHWIKATSATEQKWPNALGYSGALLIGHQLRAVFCGSRAIVKTVVFTALIIRLQFSSEKGGGKRNSGTKRGGG